MAKQQIIITSLLLAALCGCSNKGKSVNERNEFYTTTGGWDWIRVPLLSPYEVNKVDSKIKTNNWSVKFFNSLGTYNVKRVDVKDSIIYILSGKINEENDSTLVNLRNVSTGWYIIDAKKRIEKSFSSEGDFKAYVSEKHYPVPQWHDIDSLSKALGEGGEVPWMPK